MSAIIGDDEESDEIIITWLDSIPIPPLPAKRVCKWRYQVNMYSHHWPCVETEEQLLKSAHRAVSVKYREWPSCQGEELPLRFTMHGSDGARTVIWYFQCRTCMDPK